MSCQVFRDGTEIVYSEGIGDLFLSNSHGGIVEDDVYISEVTGW